MATIDDGPKSLQSMVAQINDALEDYDDERWHYSRLRLTVCPLQEMPGERTLWIETISTDTREGAELLRELKHRVGAAVGHLSELPILQIVICRMNEALLDLTDDEFWHHRRPFITWAKKAELTDRGVQFACWYEVEERISDDDLIE